MPTARQKKGSDSTSNDGDDIYSIEKGKRKWVSPTIPRLPFLCSSSWFRIQILPCWIYTYICCHWLSYIKLTPRFIRRRQSQSMQSSKARSCMDWQFFVGCDACRARKVRCARDNPDDPKQPCKHCVALGIPCTYDYQPKKRGVSVNFPLVKKCNKMLISAG